MFRLTSRRSELAEVRRRLVDAEAHLDASRIVARNRRIELADLQRSIETERLAWAVDRDQMIATIATERANRCATAATCARMCSDAGHWATHLAELEEGDRVAQAVRP